MIEMFSENQDNIPNKPDNAIPESQRNKRLEICKSCPNLIMGNICKLCGCWMPLKTYFPNQKCPDNKW